MRNLYDLHIVIEVILNLPRLEVETYLCESQTIQIICLLVVAQFHEVLCLFFQNSLRVIPHQSELDVLTPINKLRFQQVLLSNIDHLLALLAEIGLLVHRTNFFEAFSAGLVIVFPLSEGS